MRNDILRDMRHLQSQMESLFDALPHDQYLPSHIVSNRYRQPLTDVFEREKEFIIKVELPGVKKKDIHLETTERGINIEVEMENEYKDENNKKGTYRFERSYTGFRRYIELPKNANLEEINANLENGLLELKIPKEKTKTKTKKVTIG